MGAELSSYNLKCSEWCFHVGKCSRGKTAALTNYRTCEYNKKYEQELIRYGGDAMNSSQPEKTDKKKSRQFPLRENPELVKILLKDRTTKKNIIWASDSYFGMGKEFSPESCINGKWITNGGSALVQPRIKKHIVLQKERTKDKAEVFTPTWIVKKQNDLIESEIMNLSLDEYVNYKWLEITCGEAPYMCTRYDAVTGAPLEIADRVGFVDRKIQRISNEINEHDKWVKYVSIAYKSSYGYEFQGDSLLIARENLLYTFIDYYKDKFNDVPSVSLMKDIASIISYNMIQMDGLKYIIPYSEERVVKKKDTQLSIFGDLEKADGIEIIKEGIKTEIKDWVNHKIIMFECLENGEGRNKSMKFDVVIGNPPYQEDSGTSARDDAIYNYFYDSAELIGKKYCLISPARFLFNAGSTSKAWNKKMLNDKHLKVIFYEQDSSKVFPNVGIAGGVVVLYRNEDKDFGSIQFFTSFKELNSISNKVSLLNEITVNSVFSGRGVYRLTEKAIKDFPEIENIQSKGHIYDVGTSAFEILGEFLYHSDIPNDSNNYVRILGRYNNERTYRWIHKDYINQPRFFEKYRIAIPKAYGTGITDKEVASLIIGEPIVIKPFTAFTETFISFGSFNSEEEAENALKYIKSKFARAMLAVLKVTQDNTREKWSKVPLQNFTPTSDIDWTKSISEIDQQLYEKYGLSQEEIDFIETRVKEMK